MKIREAVYTTLRHVSHNVFAACDKNDETRKTLVYTNASARQQRAQLISPAACSELLLAHHQNDCCDILQWSPQHASKHLRNNPSRKLIVQSQSTHQTAMLVANHAARCRLLSSASLTCVCSSWNVRSGYSSRKIPRSRRSSIASASSDVAISNSHP